MEEYASRTMARDALLDAAQKIGVTLGWIEIVQQSGHRETFGPTRAISTIHGWRVSAEVKTDNGFGKQRWRILREQAENLSQAVERMIYDMANPITAGQAE